MALPRLCHQYTTTTALTGLLELQSKTHTHARVQRHKFESSLLLRNTIKPHCVCGALRVCPTYIRIITSSALSPSTTRSPTSTRTDNTHHLSAAQRHRRLAGAMTHMYEGCRRDTIRFLHIVLDSPSDIMPMQLPSECYSENGSVSGIQCESAATMRRGTRRMYFPSYRTRHTPHTMGCARAREASYEGSFNGVL